MDSNVLAIPTERPAPPLPPRNGPALRADALITTGAVSTVLDTHGNLIERFADDSLIVTLSRRTDRTVAQVESWYWRYVAWWTPEGTV